MFGGADSTKKLKTSVQQERMCTSNAQDSLPPESSCWQFFPQCHRSHSCLCQQTTACHHECGGSCPCVGDPIKRNLDLINRQRFICTAIGVIQNGCSPCNLICLHTSVHPAHTPIAKQSSLYHSTPGLYYGILALSFAKPQVTLTVSWSPQLHSFCVHDT